MAGRIVEFSPDVTDDGEDVMDDALSDVIPVKSKCDKTESRGHRAWQMVVRVVRRFLMFLFSHVGLMCAVAAYAMLGAWLFLKLEAQPAMDIRVQAASLRSAKVLELVELAKTLNNSEAGRELWLQEAERLMIALQDDTHALSAEAGWDGMQPDDEEQWSFAGSLLYCVTVVTTIGYGHIAPKTAWGRVVTIIYAIFGIPLTFLCLRNIGSFLSNVFKFVYRHACIGLMHHYVSARRRWRRWRKISQLTRVIQSRRWSFQLHMLQTRTGRRRYDYADGGDMLDEEELKEKLAGEEDLEDVIMQQNLDKEIAALRKDKSRLKTGSKVRVPISMTLLIMTGYILGGAIMFTLWEKGWDFLISIYFCFITLTTIGFGDFVPGFTVDEEASQAKRISCSLYLVLGMAMQATCFHLVQEEVKLKVRSLGLRLGLIEPDPQPPVPEEAEETDYSDHE